MNLPKPTYELTLFGWLNLTRQAFVVGAAQVTALVCTLDIQHGWPVGAITIQVHDKRVANTAAKS